MRSKSFGCGHTRSLSADLAAHYQPFRLPPSPPPIQQPTEVPPSSPVNKKPHMKRGQSHKMDPFLSIRQILTNLMPPNWKSQHELHLLSKSYVAVSVGLFPACIIEDYPLDRFGTELLAAALDDLNPALRICYIIDLNAKILIFAHSGILSERISNFGNEDDTVFVSFWAGQLHLINPHDLRYMATTFALIQQSLLNPFTRVCQIGAVENPDNSLQSIKEVSCFMEWIVGSPVAYVSGAFEALEGKTDKDWTVWEKIKSSNRRIVKVVLEGNEASYDHVLDLVVPNLFQLDSLNGTKPVLSGDAQSAEKMISSLPNLLTFREIENRLQSLVFSRLNESSAASRIWSDVSVIVEN